jgi:4-hydroxy-tetrahydrodipicolinate synthase
MAPFLEALSQNGRINPIPILRGAIETATGMQMGRPRSPLAPATDAELAVVRRTLESLGIVQTVAV